MRTSFATISRQGARSNNEDYLLVMDRPEAKRLTGIVCDGMGGHSCGEVASLTVCNCIAHYWEQHTALPDSPEKVLEACREASAAMDRKAAEEGIAEMGTTLVMASIEADSVTIAARCWPDASLPDIPKRPGPTSRASDCRRATASCCAPTDSMEPSDEAFCWAR